MLKKLDREPARFATLTLRHSDACLADQVDRLYTCFTKLRATRVWKRHVVGGCAFIEVKWIERTQQWHPHLHCVLHGRYFPKQLLSATWHKITGDSFITDIRSITDQGRIAHYVTKYAAKSVNDTFLNRSELLDQVVVCFRGRRLCHTFGTWRGLKLTESPNDRDWEAIGSFHEVCVHALAGDPEAADAIASICGDRRAEILAAVRLARPPPVVEPDADVQLSFTWPPIDSRF